MPLGTGGGLYHFRDQILAGGPEAFFVLNADVCSDFPLSAMLAAYRREPHPFLLLGTTVRGPGGLEGAKGVIRRSPWNAECQGGRGSPESRSGNGHRQGDVPEIPARSGGGGGAPEPFGCSEVGRGEGSCQFSPCGRPVSGRNTCQVL